MRPYALVLLTALWLVCLTFMAAGVQDLHSELDEQLIEIANEYPTDYNLERADRHFRTVHGEPFTLD
jgi:hypothetical protein